MRIWNVVALVRMFPGAISSAKGLQRSLVRYKAAKGHEGSTNIDYS